MTGTVDGPPSEPAPAPEPAADDTGLGRSAARGARWGALAGLWEQLASTASTVVLARLLTPADFGLVAVATVALGLLALLTRFGVSASLVARAEVTPRQASTAFWANTALGGVAASLLALLAGPIATAVGDARAAPLLRVYAVVLVFNLASAVPRDLLRRELRFGPTYVVDVLDAGLYAAVAVALAAATDLGPWAIIVGRVVASVVAFVANVVAARWRPRFELDVAELRADLGFNLGFLGANVTAYTSKNADYWVVARIGTTADLGEYYTAYVLPNILRQRLTWLAGDILFPVLGRLHRGRGMAPAYVETNVLLLAATLPAFVGIALLAPEVVGVFLGPQWDAAVPLLQVLAPAAGLDTLNVVAANTMFARRRAGRSFQINLVRLPPLAVGLAIAYAAGDVRIAAWAVLTSTVVTLAASLGIVARDLPLRLGDLLRPLVPVVLATAVMAAVVVSARAVAPERGSVGALLLLSAAGAAAYGGWLGLVHRSTATRLWTRAAMVLKG